MSTKTEFPCSLFVSLAIQQHPDAFTVASDSVCRTIDIPFPTHRLASAALNSLRVDAELSPSVSRTLSLTTPVHDPTAVSSTVAEGSNNGNNEEDGQPHTVLRTEYKAVSNRMLRVAVNGFMESVKVVLEVMQQLDVDILAKDLGK